MKSYSLHIWCGLLILFYSCEILAEKYNDSLRYHFIIAFDKAGCDWNIEQPTASAIESILFSHQDGLLDRDQLYQDGDYVSFLGFAIDPKTAKDMNAFAFPMVSHGEKKVFQTYTEKELRRFIGTFAWMSMIGQPIEGDKKFSLVSIAKPYSLMALKSNYIVNRTFIITITDHRYNGKDFYDELNAFEQFSVRQNWNALKANVVCNKAYQVDQFYYTRYYDTKVIGSKKYAELYEFVPLQQHFTLSHVIEYPKEIKASMRRGGCFEINLNLQERDNLLFKIENLEVYLDRVIENTYSSPPTAINATSSLNGQNLSFQFKKEDDIHALKIRAWVRMKDGIYNNTVLSPSKNSPIEFGREGLNISVPIEWEQTIKIYNVIPLCYLSWLPCFKTQASAVMFWQIAIPIIIIFFIWLSVFYVRPYTPKAGDFKLVKKSSNTQ